MRDSLAEALSDGSRGVTAKVRWLSTAAATLDSDRVEEGRPRWIHCTPLLGQSGAVGVWIVVLVDDEKTPGSSRRFRQAPPVSNDVRNPNHAAGNPATRDFVDSDYEFEARSGLRQYQTPNGVPRHVLESMRRGSRPGSAMSSEQWLARSSSPVPHPGTEPSINSFAL